ncbi:MAG: hypothetical protein CTY15_01070 [Methylocystis sp.]|nr:MAG: hypothetical protein CTY15_01070 [Methylocystis sp.]
MIQHRPCVNGILAAVLSASILPIHGALAKEKTPAAHKAVASKAAKKIDKQDAPKEESAKPEGSGAGAPSAIPQ